MTYTHRKTAFSIRIVHTLACCLAALCWLHCSAESEKPIPVPQLPPAIAPEEGRASSEIFGSVFFAGQPPSSRTWPLNNDQACGHEGASTRAAEDFVRNTNATLRHVFVYISSGLSARPFPVPQDSVFLDQHGCRYLPHVFGIQVGQPLVLLNSDDTFHNVFAAAKENRPFNLGMTLSVRRLVRRFDQPEVMVPIRCNVHPWMASYAGVLAHSFYAVTDDQGFFRLKKIPAGEYEITAWHERLGVLKQSVMVREGESKELSFKFESR